jgi:hypothetical protein
VQEVFLNYFSPLKRICRQLTLTRRDLAEPIGIFFVAAGFSVGVFYFFAAILASQLAGLPVETLALRRGTA